MRTEIPSPRVFSLVPQSAAGTGWLACALRPVEGLLGLRECEAVYRGLAAIEDPRRFLQATLAALGVRCAGPEGMEQIPPAGPTVVVANHPYGGIEGVLLAERLLSVRGDVKILANYLLHRIPQLRPLVIPVDPFGRRGAASANLAPLRQAMRWVAQGGLLLVFPAGEVAHLRLSAREITDPPWNPAVARIVRHARATVVPVFVRGRNRMRFHLAGLVHPRLRTALLGRELLHRRGKPLDVKIGSPIPYRWLQAHRDDRRLMEYLRWRTYVLGCTARPPRRFPALPVAVAGRKQAAIAPAQDPARLAAEIAALPAERLLARSGAFRVFLAEARDIPRVLLEIGRLRELTFRAAAEGTGKPFDLDRFDSLYLHLFIWDEGEKRIVGAYRIGQTDRILACHGREGLYTTTLFHSRMEFFRKIGPALEMGRSFIRPEYQKSYSSLLLLWKGIGSFVARNPRYRTLFGPVSISRDYSELSRRLIASTLLQHSQAKDLSLMVRPRKPAALKPPRVPGCGRIGRNLSFQDFREVCALIADLELQQKEVPVLLRQYLNLGGQLLAFSIDRSFGNVMDGLIVVDLLKTDRRTLRRYLGEEGAATFLSFHEERGGVESAVAEDAGGALRPAESA